MHNVTIKTRLHNEFTLRNRVRANCAVFVCAQTREQTVLQIIRRVADAHVNAATRAIEWSIDATMDQVTFALDKASLPRPAALGMLSHCSACLLFLQRNYRMAPKYWHIFVRHITLSNIDQFRNFFTVKIIRKFVIVLSLKTPPQCVATLPCEMPMF